MKIQLISDLHLECYIDNGLAFANKELQVAADTLVLAGDILNLTSGKELVETMSWFCDRWKNVIYVPGNHEYYLTSPGEGTKRLDKARRWFALHGANNLHILNPGVVEIEGQRFVGATMWFPETSDEFTYRAWLNDFRLIHNFVPWVHVQHEEEIQFLEREAGPNDVVITHHMPDAQSTPPRFATSPINRFFVAPDAKQVLVKEPKLWLHGHTHDGCDYMLGKTRVVCNPRGYPGEKYKKPVNLALVIDV
jgi:predicted phosphodiesterase